MGGLGFRWVVRVQHSEGEWTNMRELALGQQAGG